MEGFVTLFNKMTDSGHIKLDNIEIMVRFVLRPVVFEI